MSKFAMKKKTVHDRAHTEQVAHKHVPGRAYEIADPATKLIHTIGGGFFNEPKYYDSNRSPAAFYAELLTTGRIASTIVDEAGLTEQAREVLETATAVANSETPEDLLIIAAWARDTENGLRLRTTPQIILTVAAAHDKTKPFVAKYGTAVMQRADEVRQVFAAFRHLFMTTTDAKKSSRPHHGALPHSLRKALARALAVQSDYALLKYNGADRPTFGDVLKMVGGSKKIGKDRMTFSFFQIFLDSAQSKVTLKNCNGIGITHLNTFPSVEPKMKSIWNWLTNKQKSVPPPPHMWTNDHM